MIPTLGTHRLRIREAAEYLQCSERFLRELARSRGIRVSLVARKLYFSVEDLEAYIERCTREAVEPR